MCSCWSVSSTGCAEARAACCRCLLHSQLHYDSYPCLLPCPSLTAPEMSPHLTHRALFTQETFSPRTDDSLNWCSTPVWKFPICSLYKWSWLGLFWQVAHMSWIGMTCCFVLMPSNQTTCTAGCDHSPYVLNALNHQFICLHTRVVTNMQAGENQIIKYIITVGIKYNIVQPVLLSVCLHTQGIWHQFLVTLHILTVHTEFRRMHSVVQ